MISITDDFGNTAHITGDFTKPELAVIHYIEMLVSENWEINQAFGLAAWVYDTESIESRTQILEKTQ